MAQPTFDVKIERDGNKVAVKSPYSPDFVLDAKRAGGRWNPQAKTWEFPVEALDNVRAIVRSNYGADPLEYEGQPLADLVVRVPTGCDPATGSQWFFGGRLIAERPGRDSYVRLGEGVALLEGAFAPSGGSRRRPCIGTAREDIVLLVKNVPVGLAEKLAELHRDPPKYSVGFVVDEVRPHPDDEADQAQANMERDRTGLDLADLSDQKTDFARAISLIEELAGVLAKVDPEDRNKVISVLSRVLKTAQDMIFFSGIDPVLEENAVEELASFQAFQNEDRFLW